MEKNNTVKVGVYYNKVQDNLMVIKKCENLNMFNKKTGLCSIESKVTFEFFRDDENKIKTIEGVLLLGLDNLEYLGAY